MSSSSAKTGRCSALPGSPLWHVAQLGSRQISPAHHLLLALQLHAHAQRIRERERQLEAAVAALPGLRALAHEEEVAGAVGTRAQLVARGVLAP